MNARAARTVVLAAAALAVAFVLTWAASTGPVGVVGDFAGHRAATTRSFPTESTAPRRVDAPRELGPRTVVTRPLEWLHEAIGLACVVAILGLLWLFLRAASAWLAPRMTEDHLVADLEPVPDLERAREGVAADRERHVEALGADDVRNGIVACWVLLEHAADEAGVRRLSSETSTELVVRFLRALDVDPRPVARLAALFHEARFSTHPLGEDARAEAEAALAQVHAELAGVDA